MLSFGSRRYYGREQHLGQGRTSSIEHLAPGLDSLEGDRTTDQQYETGTITVKTEPVGTSDDGARKTSSTQHEPRSTFKKLRGAQTGPPRPADMVAMQG